MIAQDSGNRDNESHLALNLAWLEAEHGDTASAFDHLTLSIRNYHDSRDTALIRAPLAILAPLFSTGSDTTRRRSPSPSSPPTPSPRQPTPEITTAIAHLRDVLGDQTYESLARKGETMTTTAMATYAYDQIDQARAGTEGRPRKTSFESLESSCRSRGYGFRYSPWPLSQPSILSATACHPGSSSMSWPMSGNTSAGVW